MIIFYFYYIFIKQNKNIGVIFFGLLVFGKIKLRIMVDYILKKNEILKFFCRINKDVEYKYYIIGFIRCLFIY